VVKKNIIKKKIRAESPKREKRGDEEQPYTPPLLCHERELARWGGKGGGEGRFNSLIEEGGERGGKSILPLN